MNDNILNHLPHDFTILFDYMSIAETAIEQAKQTYPNFTDTANGIFAKLCPSAMLTQTRSEKLYRLYVKELIYRHAHSIETDSATDAEIIALLLELSLLAPLKHHAVGLYMRLMEKHFNYSPDGDESKLTEYETLHGEQMDELYEDAKRYLSSELPIDTFKGEFHGEPSKPVDQMTKKDILGELFKW